MQFFIFLFALFLLLLPFLLLKNVFQNRESRNLLPPGPRKLPFIGNLHQMVGSLPHQTLQKLAQKYGPLMHLQLGELSTIVVSSPKLAKEVLQTNSLAFANRPNLTVAQIMLYNSLGVTFSPYGDYWRQMRQIYVVELLNSKSIQSLFHIMDDELSNLRKSIESQKGKPIFLSQLILSYLNSTISRATVGRICNDQSSLIAATMEAAKLAGIFNLEDLYPSIKFLRLFSRVKTKLEKLYKKLDVILEDIIISHEKDKANLMEEDILDVLLRLEKKNDFQFPITRNHIKAIIFELSVAGTITSSVIVEWAMSEMVKDPSILEKAQAEVRQALRGKEKIDGSDIQGLKYLKWVIKETFRLHPPGPLLAPREAREQCEIQGYVIPVGTVTLVNAWAIGRDPEYWNDPEVFKPERFESTSIDFTGNNFELIPFGAGRRMCPGINFGVTNVELLLAQLLYHFDWELPDGMKPEELDMFESFGAAASRKNELCLHAKLYVPNP
ncbi:OLC1v1030476C1 [Oldenlandia corymbosa var. corymbosa]|uniref:OLC1v1030476C1 n=1 Tax=Oldenlandia corymbosa var. corymbosa TaxID=529605 RepID=A0AAV1CGA1_OLDCO|nr:OLC1v1030476C1 [Oldenlandia corymbosa var. corymbosa]